MVQFKLNLSTWNFHVFCSFVDGCENVCPLSEYAVFRTVFGATAEAN